MGGEFDTNKPVKTNYEVKLSNAELIKKADMPLAKNSHSLCHDRKNVYSIGGFDGKDHIPDCEIYIVHRNKWEHMQSLNHKRAQPATFTVNNKWIYTVAGHNGKDELNSVERMNIVVRGKWEIVIIESMFSPRN